jgi:hypothetical protein
MQADYSRRVLGAAVLLFISAVLGGCASTQIVSQWSDPQYKAGPLKKVVVFIAAKDEAVRRATEDRAVAGLTGATKGVASYTLFPDQNELDKKNEARIKSVLEKQGMDGAIVTRLEAVDKDAVYVPPHTYAVPGAVPPVAGVPYGSFYGYYGYAYGYAYSTPGYTYQETKYRIETLVYRLPQGNIIWTATTESVNPDSRQQVTEELLRIVGQELMKDGIIAR